MYLLHAYKNALDLEKIGALSCQQRVEALPTDYVPKVGDICWAFGSGKHDSSIRVDSVFE